MPLSLPPAVCHCFGLCLVVSLTQTFLSRPASPPVGGRWMVVGGRMGDCGYWEAGVEQRSTVIAFQGGWAAWGGLWLGDVGRRKWQIKYRKGTSESNGEPHKQRVFARPGRLCVCCSLYSVCLVLFFLSVQLFPKKHKWGSHREMNRRQLLAISC